MIAPRLVAIAILGAAAATATGLVLGHPQHPSTPPEQIASSHPVIPARPAPRPILAPAPTAAPAPTPKPTPVATATQPMVLRRVLDTGGPIPFGRWFWDEHDVPAGPVLITVDLDARVLSIFRAGYEIGTTAVIYGADDYPTPLGTFPILLKDANHHSRTYDNAPMPYTLRLTGDGVSIHGASKVGWQWASHGCVGVPVDFARKLFGAVKVGDRVVITRGKRLALPRSA